MCKTQCNSNDFANPDDLRVSMGCVAEYATHCQDTWVHIGTVWSVAETLNDIAMNARKEAISPTDDKGVLYVNR